ncbi:MAG: hypothetical protein AABX69_03250, partial [Nanoarchaeota archaeon]
KAGIWRGYLIQEAANFVPPPNYFASVAEMDEFKAESAKSSGISYLSRAIERREGYLKRANSLKTGESLSVKGTYATSWIRLNFIKTVLTGLISLAAIAGIVFGAVTLAKKNRKALVISVGVGIFTAILQIIAWAAAGFLLAIRFSAAIKLLLLFPIVLAALLALLIVPHILVGKRYGKGFGMASAATMLIVLAAGVRAVIIYLLQHPPIILY